ncbi:maleylpyruvate isomerase family mycothiol-dependent enzyme [Paeniglutamicibacter kerguelensis]|uniref:Maleylpyruvate isomerase n=1 Tax=Paeniglutamicibacter kerguelensis TaxID=254788 RepID=A0ABS4X9X7_9MICC|nr:maleylpyruvate isomerase family mycothiol-dependent enzyme [Paeniglutamicibacter kerguelensis]MBP2385281.1 maleylpyruvate isomerase [Paeniglutamicibacter kerguelensis]
MSELTQTELTHKVLSALSTLRQMVRTMDPAAAAEPSALPGWKRTQLLAHIDGFSRAATRQLDTAGAERPFEMYDGGMDRRHEAIELTALMRPDALLARTADALDALEASIRGISPAEWSLPTGFRDGGSVEDLFYAIWRELVIHTSDLALANSVADWDPDFCAHLFDALEGRVPDSRRYILQPHGAQRIVLGTGDDATVLSGTAFDLAAWLAGREPLGPIQATAGADGAALPELLPWFVKLKAKN